MSITKVTLENTSASDLHGVPITFGQVFAKGDLPAGTGLVGMQVDAKAFHADGSVRHAVVSLLSDVPAKASRIVELTPATSADSAAPPQPAPVDASVKIVLADGEYTAKYVPTNTKWLDGEIVTEVHSATPIIRADGAAHPHLHARFAVRSYHGTGNTRVDVTVENDWAYEPNPQNFTYDVTVSVDGKDVYTKKALTHLHHARWRKVLWTSDEPQVHIRHDTAYLIASKALPNYDQSVKTPEKTLAALEASWAGPKTEPMGIGLANPYMPAQGGRPDLGLLPSWAATYLLSMDARAKTVTLGTADGAGSWSSHYRDKNTGYPISLLDYPYMTIYGNPGDTKNPVTKKFEAFPKVVQGASDYHHDTAHQPGFAYLPYLVTGDYYYLEELQFWAMYNVFSTNPGYRENVKGLVSREQVRGQAWSLRTLGQAAYITPDSHPLKGAFNKVLGSNLDWYNTQYSDNPAANKLGIILNGPVIEYNNGTAISPWMDDFFTSAVGYLFELGFSDAERLLKYKAQFPIQRLVGEGTCWTEAAPYYYMVRATKTSPLFETVGEAYAAALGPVGAALPCGSPELAAFVKRGLNDMGGYPTSTEGYCANMQPGLAYSVDVSGELGKKAWEQFQKRDPKPDYGTSPQFAIVPRFEAAEAIVPAPVEVPPEIPPVEVPPKEAEPVPEAPTLPPIEAPLPAEPTIPTPIEPVKNFVPHADDTVLIAREGKTYEVAVSVLIDMVSAAIAEKFPLLANGTAMVEVVGKLTIQSPLGAAAVKA